MKQLILGVIALGTLVFANSATALDGPGWNFSNPYVGLSATYFTTNVESGGFNTISPAFPNTGSTSDNGAGGNIQAGLEKLYQFNSTVSLRAEIELDGMRSQSYTTNSCCTPSPVTFYYRTTERSEGGLLDTYLDMVLPEKLQLSDEHPITVYAGGGIGAFRHDMETQDTVVHGGNTNSSFAYQIGGGGKIVLSQSLELVLGLRYLDMGESRLNLTDIGAPVPAGDYTLNNRAVEGLIGINFTF